MSKRNRDGLPVLPCGLSPYWFRRLYKWRAVGVWPELFPMGTNRIHEGGVYAIYGDANVVYVGSSVAVWNRLAQHWKAINSMNVRLNENGLVVTPWGVFGTVSAKACGSRFYGDWGTKELRLIRRLRPAGNTMCLGRSPAHRGSYFSKAGLR